MKKLRIALLATVVFALALGGASAQEKPATDRGWDTTATQEMKVENSNLSAALGRPTGSRQDTFDLADLYRTNAMNPESLRGLVARSLHTYLVQKSTARGSSPIQAAVDAQLQLAAIQVYQNDRIIALLEELKKK